MGILLNKLSFTNFIKTRYFETFAISCLLAYLTFSSKLIDIPLCPSMIFSNTPCPTCGITRSMWNLMHGNFVLAFKLNSLGFLATFIFIRRLIVLNFDNKLINFIDGQLANYILSATFFTLYFYNFFTIVFNNH